MPEKHLPLLHDYTKAFDSVVNSQQTQILKEMGLPDDFTCLLRNLYGDQEATARTGHGKMDWSKIGKEVCQGCVLSVCLLTYMQSTSCKMPDWMKQKLESRLLGEIPINSDMQMTPHLWQKAKNKRAS